MLNKCFNLNADSIGATVAPQIRSVNDKLHRIKRPGRAELIPLLNNAIMTAALDTKHQIPNSIVGIESQAVNRKYLFWNDMDISGAKQDRSSILCFPAQRDTEV